MRLLTIILLFMSSLAYSQELKTQVVTFTEVALEDIGDSRSFYIGYTDSSGKEHYSDMIFGYGVDIKVDGIMLFDYDDDILMLFNEIYAEQLIGKKIKMTYREKENYFHEIVPVVTNLSSN
jgi:hypothetical protein